MSLLQNAIKSSRLLQSVRQNEGFSSFLHNSPRFFSIEPEKPNQDSPLDPFLQTPTSGLVYGRLLGITTHTTRTDILNLLEESNLTIDDIKVDYDRSYNPMAMMIKFPSRYAFDAAVRRLGRKGRLYKLDRITADRSKWDLIAPYDGKAVLLQGIPRNALPDDIERFLFGCQYDASSMQIFARPGFPDPVRMAVVRFPSPILALQAFITKNRDFCLNNKILVRILQ